MGIKLALIILVFLFLFISVDAGIDESVKPLKDLVANITKGIEKEFDSVLKHNEQHAIYSIIPAVLWYSKMGTIYGGIVGVFCYLCTETARLKAAMPWIMATGLFWRSSWRLWLLAATIVVYATKYGGF